MSKYSLVEVFMGIFSHNFLLKWNLNKGFSRCWIYLSIQKWNLNNKKMAVSPKSVWPIKISKNQIFTQGPFNNA
jgi:hypothetical protein